MLFFRPLGALFSLGAESKSDFSKTLVNELLRRLLGVAWVLDHNVSAVKLPQHVQ